MRLRLPRHGSVVWQATAVEKGSKANRPKGARVYEQVDRHTDSGLGGDTGQRGSIKRREPRGPAHIISMPEGRTKAATSRRELITCARSGSGCRKASPQDHPLRQRPGCHNARCPSSRSVMWRQERLRSDLRGDPWCSQDLFRKMFVQSSLPLSHCSPLPPGSSVIQSHTPSTPGERPSPLSMSSMPLSGQDVLPTVSVLRYSLPFRYAILYRVYTVPF